MNLDFAAKPVQMRVGKGVRRCHNRVQFPIARPEAPMFLAGPDIDPTKYHGDAVGIAGLFYRYILPGLAALIAPALTALVKKSMDLSHSRRSEALTEKISKLGDYIHGLPEVPPEDLSGPTPRQALMAEMNAAILELSQLQNRKRVKLHAMPFSLGTRLRAAFLLYRPRGLRAFLVYGSFWFYSAVYLFMLAALLAPGKDSLFDTSSAASLAGSIIGYLVMAAIFSVPSVLLHLAGIKIHRKQCAEAPQPTVITTVTVQQGEKISA
jgi:hypothetical protein